MLCLWWIMHRPAALFPPLVRRFTRDDVSGASRSHCRDTDLIPWWGWLLVPGSTLPLSASLLPSLFISLFTLPSFLSILLLPVFLYLILSYLSLSLLSLTFASLLTFSFLSTCLSPVFLYLFLFTLLPVNHLSSFSISLSFFLPYFLQSSPPPPPSQAPTITTGPDKWQTQIREEETPDKNPPDKLTRITFRRSFPRRVSHTMTPPRLPSCAFFRCLLQPDCSPILVNSSALNNKGKKRVWFIMFFSLVRWLLRMIMQSVFIYIILELKHSWFVMCLECVGCLE